MSDKKTPPSMNEFDYFSEDEKPSPEAANDLPEGLDEQLAAFRRSQRRQQTLLLIALATFLVAGWFFWGYRDWMRYELMGPAEPLELGDVTRLTPTDLEHNTFVSLRGITGTRGITQQMVRGLSVSRDERWFFLLSGSEGIFVEVNADAEHFGFATEVRARGRVVDPKKEPAYAAVLMAYSELHHPTERSEHRFVQVGAEPGGNRVAYILAILLLGGLLAVNVWVVMRVVRERRNARHRGLFGR